MADAENKVVRSKREDVLSRLKSRYPDAEYTDDEALFGQIYDDYDNYDKDIEAYKKNESTLIDLFERNPRAAQFITDMAKGKDPWISVIERLGIDGIMALMNDPEKKAEYAKANEDYVASVAKNKELEAEWEKNRIESSDLLDKIQSERGLSDEERDAVVQAISRIAQDALIGKYTPETIDMVLSAMRHDADVANAREEGTIAGRNAKIEAQLRKSEGGDGMPSATGSSSAPQVQKGYSIFDDARGAN